jgi:hypothetical protein
VRSRKRLRGLLAQAEREPTFETLQQLQAGVQQVAQALPPEHRQQLIERQHSEPTQQAAWLLTCLRAEVHKLDNAHQRLDGQRRTQQYRHTVATRPKVANRQVRSAGKDEQTARLTAVIDPKTGKPTTNAETVVVWRWRWRWRGPTLQAEAGST